MANGPHEFDSVLFCFDVMPLLAVHQICHSSLRDIVSFSLGTLAGISTANRCFITRYHVATLWDFISSLVRVPHKLFHCFGFQFYVGLPHV